MKSFKTTMQSAALILGVVASSSQFVPAQQFAFSEKGKTQPVIYCIASLDHFDGTTLWLKPVNTPAGYSACITQPLSAQKWQMVIQLTLPPDALNGSPANSENSSSGRWNKPGPNPVDPGRIASSIGQLTKDTDLQRAQVQIQAQSNQNQGSSQSDRNRPNIDLTDCKGCGTDSIQTTAGGSVSSVSGNIKSISNGWVDLQQKDMTQPQKYRMLNIVAITIGACP